MAIVALTLTVTNSQIAVAKPAIAQSLCAKTNMRIDPQRLPVFMRTSFNPVKTKVPTPDPQNIQSRQANERKNSASAKQTNGISVFSEVNPTKSRNTDLLPVDRWTK